MNRKRVRRGSAMTAVASFALVVLAACGGIAQEVEEDVTRVPEMSDAAAQETRTAANAPASPAAGAETATTGSATPATSGEAPATAAATSVEVVSYDIYFEPKELTIPANTDVTFVLPNDGVTAHNFSIDELDISVDLPPGETKEVVINAPAGTYEFYCNVPGHKEAGMVGTLIVSEEAAPAPATPVGDQAAAPAATPIVEGVAASSAAAAPQTVDVVSYDIYFEPKELTIPANTDVTVNLPNDGVTAHNFSIDALGISVDLPPGESKQVVINAPAGTYEFYCDVPGHKEAGMVGTLIVSEDAAAAPAGTPAAGASSVVATPGQAAAATPAVAANASPAAEQAAAGAVEVVSHDIFFEPKELSIPADTAVTVSLPNEGVTLHNFSIDELGIDVDLAPGATEETVINAPAGTYEFYCNVPGHKQAGMVGTLTVG